MEQTVPVAAKSFGHDTLNPAARQRGWARRLITCALLLVGLLGARPDASAQAFVHPGLLHTQADFTRMQTKVAANAQPWKGSWDILVANNNSSLTRNFANPAPATVYRGADGIHPENYASLFTDIAAAYATALRWKVTGDVAYANKSIAIMNSWSANLTALEGTSDKFLAAGIYGYEFANAAEIMRSYSGWAPADFARFQNMMLTVFYPMNHDFLLNHNGACISNYWANWDLCNTASMLAIGVLCDQRAIYNEAVDYFKFGAGNGAINQLVPYVYGSLGQWQESGRDQGHGMLGVALAGSLAEMAWHQGDDLYGYNNSMLLKGFEYIAKYNLGYDVPYTTYRNCIGNVQTVVSTDARGNVRPVWEMVYNHYVNRQGLSAPYSALYAQRVRPEGGGGNYGPNSGGYDQLGYGSLTFSLDEPARPQTQTITFPAIPAQAFGAPDFSPAATASSGLPITYSVLDPTVASVTATGQLHVLRPGTTTVYAQQMGDATYNPAPVVSQSLTVNQVPGTTDGTWSNTAGTLTSAINSTSGSANLTWAGQSFVVGEHLKLNAPVPGGFTAGTIYTVVAVSNGGSTFQLALQPGGTPIGATSTITNGVGQRLQKWQVTTNWSGGTLPSGPNATATFGATSFANVPGVTLDGNITIGNLVYAANGTSELVLASGLNNGRLTFATASGTPTLTMINSGTRKLFMGQAINNARVPLRIAGTQGLNISTPIQGGATFAGLRIQAAMDWSNFSGTLSLLQGSIELHNTTNSPTGADNVLLPPGRLSLGASATAVVSFTGSSTAAQMQTIGALDGTSDAFILAKTSLTNGAPTLAVGADNLDGSYDGYIGMGAIGAAIDQGRLNLEKVGTGTQVISGIIKNGQTGTDNSAVVVRNGKLVLAGNNEYLGGTTVLDGTLEVNGTVASAVAVQAGTVAGTGRSTAPLTVGTGAGTGATLAPGSSGVGTFTTTGPVSLMADATYALEINSAANAVDKLIAGGLALTNALLNATDLTSNTALPIGAIYLIVDNTGSQPVSGTFLNQPEGSSLTVGNTVFRLSYLGGTGNDVTLTVTSNTLPNLVVSSAQNLQGNYNNLTITGPTTGGAGAATLTGSLTVAGTLTVQAGGMLNVGCQPLTGAGSFALQAGGELRICDAAGLAATGNTGGVQLAGPRSFSPDASYVYNGSTPQATGPGLPGRVRNLTIDNSSGLTLSNSLGVAQMLTVTAGDLAAGNNLTLLSDASGTAMVVNTGGVVNGTVTVQRYVDRSLNAAAGYRHYSSPVQSTTMSDLATTGFTPTVNLAYNTQGNTVTPFPTIFGYDETSLTATAPGFDQGWASPSALTDVLNPGKGYTVNIPATETVDFVGTLSNGPLTRTGLSRGATANSGWQLVGNPYPAPINFDLLSSSNLDNALYVYKSNGQYTGTYAAYVNGLGTNGGTNQIAAMQGFFVRANSTSTAGQLTFSNAARLTTYASPSFNRTTGTEPLVRLSLQGTATAADQTVVYFQQSATTGFDGAFDAYKLTAGGAPALASLLGTEQLAINGLPALALADVTVPLAVAAPMAGTYNFSATDVLNLPTGFHAYLRDAQTGRNVDLTSQPSYPVTLAAGAATGRFSLLFSRQSVLATAQSALSQQVDLFPNPAHASVTVRLPAALPSQKAVEMSLVNALGQTVLRQKLPSATTAQTLGLTGLAQGIYTLRLETSAGTVTKRLTVE